jgi:hypothetical protein
LSAVQRYTNWLPSLRVLDGALFRRERSANHHTLRRGVTSVWRGARARRAHENGITNWRPRGARCSRFRCAPGVTETRTTPTGYRQKKHPD